MRVELVAKTLGVGKYSDLSSEKIIAAISRHGKIKEDDGRLVRYLLDKGHYSPLDMLNFTFEIETSRAIGRHILRHSSAKFQEFSQRYSDDIKFESIELRREHKTNRQSSTEVFDPSISFPAIPASKLIASHLESVNILYTKLIKAGVAKETARMILPECTSTTLTVNATLRTWLSFLNVRLEESAQKEIQEIAREIGSELVKELPNVFKNLDWEQGLFM